MPVTHLCETSIHIYMKEQHLRIEIKGEVWVPDMSVGVQHLVIKSTIFTNITQPELQTRDTELPEKLFLV